MDFNDYEKKNFKDYNKNSNDDLDFSEFKKFSHDLIDNEEDLQEDLYNNVSNNKQSKNEDYKNYQQSIDVRIIVEGAKEAEIISNVMKTFNIDKKLNILISSIIPINDIQIAKNATQGADIILIA